MKTVYKYQLIVVPRQEIQIPRSAEILHLESVGREIYMWARVDTDAEKETMGILCFGTGFDNVQGRYLSTVFCTPSGLFRSSVGAFVWHFFEEVRDEKYNKMT